MYRLSCPCLQQDEVVEDIFKISKVPVVNKVDVIGNWRIEVQQPFLLPMSRVHV